jgi:formylglycine-generating enzyme required for sulfatase activity
MSNKLILLSSVFTLASSLAAGAASATDALVPIAPPMVAIPGGQFMMGHVRARASQPVHAVTIKPFRMGK